MISKPYDLRELGPDDREQARALGILAFGGDPGAPVTAPPPGARFWGVLDGDRLLAKATWRPYEQWWGGRRVPMGGVAGVAVHPDARGQGASGRLMRRLLELMREQGQPVSVLYPTAPGIYRSLGWELVGSLDETVLPTASLRGAHPADPGLQVRTAGLADLPFLTQLWHGHGAATNGQLTRDGPSFPRGLERLLGHDVVSLAELDDVPVGYLAYDRGRGYGSSAELQVAELVARSAAAQPALLRSLASWDTVAPVVRWTGSLAEVALSLPGAVPAPAASRPWMVRITDAPRAVAARGFAPEACVQAAFTLVDPAVPEHEGSWQLTVADGAGRLERTHADAPRLHVRGLALLYAGVADPARLLRTGLLDAPVPGLQVFAAPAPELTDYF